MSHAGPSPRRRYRDPPDCPWCAALKPPKSSPLQRVDRGGMSDPAVRCKACHYEEIPPPEAAPDPDPPFDLTA